MRFDPLIALWLLVPVCLAGLAFVGWQEWRRYATHKSVSVDWLRRALLIVLVLLAGVGPSVAGATSSPGVTNVDVLFLVDTTASMGATDYAGTSLRIDGAKQDMLAIGSRLRGASMGIITFDSNADTVLPFTSDATVFEAAVQTVNREVYGTSKGSSIDKPLQMAKTQLQARQAADPQRSRLVFYLGDGENTSETKPKSFSALAKYIDGGGVLGYGTTKGASMLKYTGTDDSQLKNPPTSDLIMTPDPNTKQFVPAVSKLDESALRQIAKDSGVTYKNRDTGGSIDNVIAASRAKILLEKNRKVKHYFNLYWLLALPIAALLFWEWHKLFLLLLGIRISDGKGKRHV